MNRIFFGICGLYRKSLIPITRPLPTAAARCNGLLCSPVVMFVSDSIAFLLFEFFHCVYFIWSYFIVDLKCNISHLVDTPCIAKGAIMLLLKKRGIYNRGKSHFMLMLLERTLARSFIFPLLLYNVLCILLQLAIRTAARMRLAICTFSTTLEFIHTCV